MVTDKHSDFKRDVTVKLERWFNQYKDYILFINGARQVGKTYEIKRFAKKHFRNVIYVDLIVDKLFKEKITDENSISMLNSLQEYCKIRGIQFENSKNTILIIDEIQSSIEIYNLLKVMRENLGYCIAITGSYLGFLVNRKSFISDCDLYSVEMTPLTFKEFCDANKIPYEQCDITKDFYNIYCQIGGFPRVVSEYIRSKNVQNCFEIIKNLWDMFCKESNAYIKYIPCENVFDKCMHRVAIQIIKNSFFDLLNDEDKVVTVMTERVGDTHLISNKILKQSYLWLCRSGLLGVCEMHRDGNVHNSNTDICYYIRDLGLANFLLKRTGYPDSDIEGALTECFVYNELRNSASSEIVSGIPDCAVYQNYKLDFVFVDSVERNIMGIEAKALNTETKSLRVFKENKLIDIAIKTGMFKYQINPDGLVNYPIYMIGNLSVDKILNEIQRSYDF